jgi:excisionase family DNA binding protein
MRRARSNGGLPEPMTLAELRSKDIITVPEAAAFLRISRDTAYSSARSGELPGVKHVSKRRYVVVVSTLIKELGL